MFHKKSILVVEDDPFSQKIITKIFDALGYDEVQFACNGAKALSALRYKIYDLVLMDILLPDIKGDVMIKLIRNKEANSKKTKNHTPIVVLTANQNPTLKQRCYMAGVDEFLLKPLTINTAKKILKHYELSLAQM